MKPGNLTYNLLHVKVPNPADYPKDEAYYYRLFFLRAVFIVLFRISLAYGKRGIRNEELGIRN